MLVISLPFSIHVVSGLGTSLSKLSIKICVHREGVRCVKNTNPIRPKCRVLVLNSWLHCISDKGGSNLRNKGTVLLIKRHMTFEIGNKNISSHSVECGTCKTPFFASISRAALFSCNLQLRNVVHQHSANFN